MLYELVGLMYEVDKYHLGSTSFILLLIALDKSPATCGELKLFPDTLSACSGGYSFFTFWQENIVKNI